MGLLPCKHSILLTITVGYFPQTYVTFILFRWGQRRHELPTPMNVGCKLQPWRMHMAPCHSPPHTPPMLETFPPTELLERINGTDSCLESHQTEAHGIGCCLPNPTVDGRADVWLISSSLSLPDLQYCTCINHTYIHTYIIMTVTLYQLLKLYSIEWGIVRQLWMTNWEG